MHLSSQKCKYSAFEYLFILSPPSHTTAGEGSLSISLAVHLSLCSRKRTITSHLKGYHTNRHGKYKWLPCKGVSSTGFTTQYSNNESVSSIVLEKPADWIKTGSHLSYKEVTMKTVYTIRYSGLEHVTCSPLVMLSTSLNNCTIRSSTTHI